MYILALYGSPRKQGNTDILLDEFLKGASSTTQDIQIERIYIRDLKISPCLEYNACLQTGKCIIQDEMDQIYDKLLAADIVVLSAPLFFSNVPAQVKMVIDRCQALWARKYVLKDVPHSERPRRGFFIATGGMKRDDIFAGCLMTVKNFFKAINVDYTGALLYNKIDAKGAIKAHPTALKEAFKAGENIIT